MNDFTPEKEQLLKSRKRKFGLTYGAAGGLAFAIALWGFDAILLSQSHAMFPWLKLLVGGILTTFTGGLAGWLTSRFEKILLGFLFWVAASALFGLYIVIVPLVLAPRITGLLVPQIRHLLLYTTYDNLPTMVAVAFGWTIVGAIISSVIQLPMLDHAVFSFSGFGKIRPHLLCAILMLISGSVSDSLNNKPLRDPIIALDSTFQFILDTRGQEIDKATSREKHLASFRLIQQDVTENRQLVVSHYDRLLENIEVLVNFDGKWAICPTFFNSPLTCQPISP
ncbi:MAG: hypothetical protein C4583_13650 [Anaerolineaceae bacterium]|nr:MAG: hypothetical protein C4583_13650 [Anaerolineaceae bacterium]